MNLKELTNKINDKFRENGLFIPKCQIWPELEYEVRNNDGRTLECITFMDFILHAKGPEMDYNNATEEQILNYIQDELKDIESISRFMFFIEQEKLTILTGNREKRLISRNKNMLE